MINKEPRLRVGIMEGQREVSGCLNGSFHSRQHPGRNFSGNFSLRIRGTAEMVFTADRGGEITDRFNLSLLGEGQATFTLHDVTIGNQFHWERRESQTFSGNLRLLAVGDGTLTVINDIALEDYLTSVISSEMSATAPMALLEAHAIISRSWLVSMLQRRPGMAASSPSGDENEHLAWYGREEHGYFDVCADDHCQRYQGVTRSIPARTSAAVIATWGMFLVSGEAICDARYYKCCGGRTEAFENVWEAVPHPYLSSISDAAVDFPPVLDEESARRWLLSSPEAYCNTGDEQLLSEILPSFDQETKDFFRWQVAYEQEELAEILKNKSGIDFGLIQGLIPLERGPSGRIVRLKIVGTKTSLVVGKELEIRRWLSRSHLYSSAFVVDAQEEKSGAPARFVLHGGGWGHGVGLCQIGAAVMASKGIPAETILKHYFPGSTLKKLY